ncbi:MAG: hypothetical protein IT327_11605 [Anaerolineae bacterium]|nr:hypothetical protein [Anaerolineae bacterium]
MLATVLLADFANLTDNSKINVMGVFRQINAGQFPCRHLSMYLVINLQTMPLDELHGEMVLVARLIDADGTVLHQLEMPFTFPEWSGNLRPEANFIFQINNLQFSYPGEYVWDVFVNDENVGRYEFNLNQQAKENG